jgi:hypothetical protein
MTDEKLKTAVARFHDVALWVVENGTPSAEQSVALRKLLEAKDAAVRNVLERVREDARTTATAAAACAGIRKKVADGDFKVQRDAATAMHALREAKDAADEEARTAAVVVGSPPYSPREGGEEPELD